MPLFDLSGDAPRKFKRLQSATEVYEREIEDLFWSDLEAFAGEPLFPVARQPTLAGGGRPDLLAIDTTGRVVVIEVKRDVDRSQLAQCLEYAGWARTTNLQELANLYHLGSAKFFEDWQSFTSTATPRLLQDAPRLILVARSFDPRTEAAIALLEGNDFPLTRIPVVFYEDSNGDRIVDVGFTETQPGLAQTATPVVTVGKTHYAARPLPASLADLLEAKILHEDEPIVWRRPQVGHTHQAVVTANGEIKLSDGRLFSSLSAACDLLGGGSFNGWECWAVPRLGGVRIGALRSELPI